MKKSYSKRILLVCLCVVAIGLTACSNPSPREIESKGHFFMTNFGGGLQNFPFDVYTPDTMPVYNYSMIVLMSSKEQTAIFDDVYSQSLNATQDGWERDEQFTNLINSYDDEFFQDNQIVTFFASTAGGAYYLEISETIYSDGVLTIEINHIAKQGVGGHAAIVDYFVIVEIEKVPTNTEIIISVKNRDSRLPLLFPSTLQLLLYG